LAIGRFTRVYEQRYSHAFFILIGEIKFHPTQQPELLHESRYGMSRDVAPWDLADRYQEFREKDHLLLIARK
jgi:hypothetical protein